MTRLAVLNGGAAGADKLMISVGFARTSSELTISDALAQADARMHAQKLARRRARSIA